MVARGLPGIGGERKVDESTWRLRKAASLVKLLALAPGHRLHRERAMDLFWPDLGQEEPPPTTSDKPSTPPAGPSSRPSRWFALPERSEDESLVLCPEGDLWVDVDAFEEAAQPPVAPETRQPTGQRSSCTRASCCPKTATRSGRRAAVKS